MAQPDPRAAARALAERLAALSAQAGTTLAVFVPVHTVEKKPVIKHRGGEWSHEMGAQWLKRPECGASGFRVGMLLYGLVVIDFDRAKLYPAWAAEFPELEAAPAERTRKGMHCYFLRCPAAEAADLTDGPLNDPATGQKADVDVKTVTSSVVNGLRTGSLLVCAPSQNYEWLPGRSLLELDPNPMSSALLEKVSAWRSAGVKESKKGCRGGGSKRPRVDEQQPALEGAPRLEAPAFFASDEDVKEALGLFGLQTDDYSITRQEPAAGTLLEFLKLRPRGPCDVCGDTHKDSLIGTIWFSSRAGYELKVAHRRDKKCVKRCIIAQAQRADFERRVEGGNRAPAEEAGRVGQLLAGTG